VGECEIFSSRVFLPVSTGTKNIKNRPRKARVIIKNKVARFYGSQCSWKKLNKNENDQQDNSDWIKCNCIDYDAMPFASTINTRLYTTVTIYINNYPHGNLITIKHSQRQKTLNFLRKRLHDYSQLNQSHFPYMQEWKVQF